MDTCGYWISVDIEGYFGGMVLWFYGFIKTIVAEKWSLVVGLYEYDL
jgi:hypothetical protein